MKCIECGTEMKTTRENAPFKALPGTVLVGVDVSRCPKCGWSETAIRAWQVRLERKSSVDDRPFGTLRAADQPKWPPKCRI